jgi:hypothetical protein
MAKRGEPAAMEHPEIAGPRNKGGLTPLHLLAESGVDVTEHPQAGVEDKWGNTARLMFDGLNPTQRAHKKQMKLQGELQAKLDLSEDDLGKVGNQ